MADIGQALDKEWAQMARSEVADEAARGWAEAEPALAGLSCVQDALDRRLDPKADVRKRYRRERRPIRLRGGVPRAGETTPSAEELVLDRTLLTDVADAKRRSVISHAALELILRTRIGEEFLYEMAAEKSTTVAILNQQRYRAERRLEFALG